MNLTEKALATAEAGQKEAKRLCLPTFVRAIAKQTSMGPHFWGHDIQNGTITIRFSLAMGKARVVIYRGTRTEIVYEERDGKVSYFRPGWWTAIAQVEGEEAKAKWADSEEVRRVRAANECIARFAPVRREEHFNA